MSYIEPPSSRNQLGWSHFKETEDGNWCLNLPPFYTSVFGSLEPIIMAKSNTGWRESRSGKTNYAFFINLDEAERERIEKFRNDYKRFIIIGLNRHLVGFGRSELTGCLALDFNFSGPEGEYTEVGQLEYNAKYHQSQEALDSLVADLVRAVHCIPGISDSKLPRFITFVPSSDSNTSTFCLPMLLCKSVISALDKSFFFTDTPLVNSRLRAPKSKIKELSLAEKQQEWDAITANGGIELDNSVSDATVIVLDDLYQSGTTMWNLARYLRNVEGAAEVFGLVCVKSLRDTDNI